MQSLVTPYGYSSEGCGYCKDGSSGKRTPNSRASYYVSSKTLTVEVYQGLVDRGWRRSGTIFYKPDVFRHCCPHYTIRLPAASFVPAREHRQAVNRWNKYILGEEYITGVARLHPKSKEEKARQRNGFDLITAVHEAEYSNLKRPPEPAHKFEVTLEPASFTREKYEVFKNYQQNVHKEDLSEISESGFKRFLCESALKRTSRIVDGKTQQLGSFHQCYRVDGRLIAVGVLDLLPHCVSGVYFIYHSDYEKWSFGKLSAMREAALALEGGYQYYYMGYYIHTCIKMRYKGEYKPSQLLDPESYEWNPLDAELRALLDSKPYVSLARERRRKGMSKKGKEATDNEDTTMDSPDDDFSEYRYPGAKEAREAVDKGLSLFDLKVPGLMTIEEIEQQLNLDEQAFKIQGRVVQAQDLVPWEMGDLREHQSLKGIVGELVAGVGPEVAPQIVVDFSG